eukprot:1403145-Prymnesium_polylepis.2
MMKDVVERLAQTLEVGIPTRYEYCARVVRARTVQSGRGGPPKGSTKCEPAQECRPAMPCGYCMDAACLSGTKVSVNETFITPLVLPPLAA